MKLTKCQCDKYFISGTPGLLSIKIKGYQKKSLRNTTLYYSSSQLRHSLVTQKMYSLGRERKTGGMCSAS